MKLNYKRTILVGFAFFLISAFWGAYDTIIPLILTNKFNMAQTASGAIMALDNILAVVLLPVFGALSDKTRTRYGRRTPYIFLGTIATVILFSALGFMPSLWSFITLLLLTLLATATFRSPAVALMPDVTVKPLRSKGNAVINLMGTAGGIVVLVLGMIFKTDTRGKTEFADYMIAVAVVMLIALAIFMLTVKETKWAAQAADLEKQLPKTEMDRPAASGKLTPAQRRSLLFLLASVVFWFMGYNAVTSKYSVYASEVLGVPYTVTLLVAQAAAIVAFVPVGILSSRLGRKKVILIGVVMLMTAFLSASFITSETPAAVMYVLFAIAGIGWASINVNSFPMAVELASEADVGKYTGYYYTASMAAQVVTPVLSGALIDLVGWHSFFPYAAVFAALAFVTMLFVRHGDSKVEKMRMEDFFGAED